MSELLNALWLTTELGLCALVICIFAVIIAKILNWGAK